MKNQRAVLASLEEHGIAVALRLALALARYGQRGAALALLLYALAGIARWRESDM